MRRGVRQPDRDAGLRAEVVGAGDHPRGERGRAVRENRRRRPASARPAAGRFLGRAVLPRYRSRRARTELRRATTSEETGVAVAAIAGPRAVQNKRLLRNPGCARPTRRTESGPRDRGREAVSPHPAVRFRRVHTAGSAGRQAEPAGDYCKERPEERVVPAGQQGGHERAEAVNQGGDQVLQWRHLQGSFLPRGDDPSWSGEASRRPRLPASLRRMRLPEGRESTRGRIRNRGILKRSSAGRKGVIAETNSPLTDRTERPGNWAGGVV